MHSNFEQIKKKKKRWTIATIFVIFLFWFVFLLLPSPLFTASTSTLIYSKEHKLLGAVIADDQQWRFPIIDSIPNKIEQCILLYEDQYFYKHWGVNPISTLKALYSNIKARKVVRGSSTITMQTIRLSQKNKKRTYFNKLLEMLMAVRLELSHSKKEILSLYLSFAPFGSNIVGVDAASWRYYGRPTSSLSWAESATLAVLPNAPSLTYPGKNTTILLQKRNKLLRKLKHNGILTQEEYELSTEEPLIGRPHPLPQSPLHLLTKAKKEHKGKRLLTTIDYKLQKKVAKVVDNHNKWLSENEIHNAAAIVLEVETGNVLAYIGNTKDEKNRYGNYVDIIQAKRSSGSILKPFLYAAMLDEGLLLPKMLLPDYPMNFGGFSPENFEEKFNGAVPADESLIRSLNVPSVYALQKYNVEKFHHLLQSMKFTTFTQPAFHYGLSAIIGGGEITLWELAQAYNTLAYNLKYQTNSVNYFVKSSYLKKQEKHKKFKLPFSSNALWHTFDALQKVKRPSSEVGWEHYSTSLIAWKTGTSQGYKDGWAVGITPKHVVAVWVGNADGEGRSGLTGTLAASPIMFDIFKHLNTDKWFELPNENVATIKYCSKSGFLSTPNCEKTTEMILPKASVNAPHCTYHKIINLDEEEKYQVKQSCYPVEKMKHKKWFVLTPIMEWYYRLKNPSYQQIPPFRDECLGKETGKPMQIVYPFKKSKLYIPKNLGGERGEIVFKIVHRNPLAKVFWHLDNQYIGMTSLDSHKKGIQPKKGIHTITWVDEQGNSLSLNFEILN